MSLKTFLLFSFIFLSSVIGFIFLLERNTTLLSCEKQSFSDKKELPFVFLCNDLSTIKRYVIWHAERGFMVEPKRYCKERDSYWSYVDFTCKENTVYDYFEHR